MEGIEKTEGIEKMGDIEKMEGIEFVGGIAGYLKCRNNCHRHIAAVAVAVFAVEPSLLLSLQAQRRLPGVGGATDPQRKTQNQNGGNWAVMAEE